MLHRDLALACRCLADVDSSLPEMQALAHTYLEHVLPNMAGGLWDRVKLRADILSSLAYFAPAMGPLLVTHLGGQSAPELTEALASLGPELRCCLPYLETVLLEGGDWRTQIGIMGALNRLGLASRRILPYLRRVLQGDFFRDMAMESLVQISMAEGIVVPELREAMAEAFEYKDLSDSAGGTVWQRSHLSAELCFDRLRSARLLEATNEADRRQLRNRPDAEPMMQETVRWLAQHQVGFVYRDIARSFDIDAQTRDQLARALADNDTDEMKQTLCSVIWGATSWDQLRSELASEDRARREAAASQVSVRTDLPAEIVTELRSALRDESSYVRARAADALARVCAEDEDVDADLIGALDERRRRLPLESWRQAR